MNANTSNSIDKEDLDAQAVDQNPMTQISNMEGATPELVSESKFTVLVVEDDAPIRETLREFLIGKNYKVSVARSGERAIALLDENHAFDIVLTDLRLPAGDGVEVLRRARERNPSGYVVLMTGFASLESAIEAVRLGAFDYLVKPFSLTELDLTLDRISEHRQLARANERLNGELQRLRPLNSIDQEQQSVKEALYTLSEEVKRQAEVLQRVANALGVSESSASTSATASEK